MTDQSWFKTKNFKQFYQYIVNAINLMKKAPNNEQNVQTVESKLEKIKKLLLDIEPLLPQQENRSKKDYFTELETFLNALHKFNFNARLLDKLHWRFWDLIDKEKSNTDGESIQNNILRLKNVEEIPDDELIQSIILRLRFFIDKSENMSIQKIAESYENGNFENIQIEDKDKVAKIAKIYNDLKLFINLESDLESDRLVKHEARVNESLLDEPKFEELSEESTNFWADLVLRKTEKFFPDKLLNPVLRYARLKGTDVNWMVNVRENEKLRKMNKLMNFYLYGYYAHQDEHSSDKFLEKFRELEEIENELSKEICKIFFVTLLLAICECIFDLELINDKIIKQ